MEPSSDNVQTFAAMFDGYFYATRRFREAAKTRDATATFIPLFEALNWAVALDDRAAKHWTPAGQALGWEWRKKVSDAEIIQGVRFTRNRVHHQWSDALKLDERGFSFPMTFPLVFFEWRWRPADELPQSEDERHKDPDGEEIYRQLLEGQPARVTLDTLTAVFHFLRQVLEPSSLKQPPISPVITGA